MPRQEFRHQSSFEPVSVSIQAHQSPPAVTHCTSCPLKSTVHVQDSFLGSGPPFSRASNSFQYLEKSSPAWPGAVGGGGGQQRRGPSIIRSALRKLTTLGTSSDHLDKTSKQTRRFGGGSIFRRGNPSQHNPADSLRYRLALKMPPCKSKEFFLGMTSLDDGYNSTTSKSLPQVRCVIFLIDSIYFKSGVCSTIVQKGLLTFLSFASQNTALNVLKYSHMSEHMQVNIF